MLKTSCSVGESALSKTEHDPILLILRGVAITESSADVTGFVERCNSGKPLLKVIIEGGNVKLSFILLIGRISRVKNHSFTVLISF